MSDHHHHHHRKDFATLYKEKNLRSIRVNRMIDKCLKIILLVIAVIMAIAVIYVYKFA